MHGTACAASGGFRVCFDRESASCALCLCGSFQASLYRLPFDPAQGFVLLETVAEPSTVFHDGSPTAQARLKVIRGTRHAVRTGRRAAVNADYRSASPRKMPDSLCLPGDNEAHVWTGLLSEMSPCLRSMERLLSVEEERKAARFLRPDDRSRYCAAHVMLRLLLGQYLTLPPAELAFVENAFGKPALARRAGQPPISFNLAHSGDVLVCAMAIDRRVGVDVEALRDEVDIEELAESQFSRQEADELRGVHPAERKAAFFRCWTRKEAYVKARGEGLSFPLKEFAVSFASNKPPRVQWAADDPSASAHWSVFDLAPAPGYAGAVVVEGRPVRLISRPWVASALEPFREPRGK